MKNNNTNAFSIIEILVWIFIFSLWIASVYAIIISTLRLNYYNENYIIAVNLAREQTELVRNIRDSNYNQIQIYNKINPSLSNNSDIFEYNKKYTIENNYNSAANFPIKIVDISNWFEEWEANLLWSSMKSYNLCLDSKNRYTYDCSSPGNKKTIFYKYISIEKVIYDDWNGVKEIENSFIVKSKVIWYKKWYNEFELKSIIADWKRL